MFKMLKVANILQFISFILLSLLIFIMAVQVFARQFLGSIPVWSGEEATNLLLVWIINIGAGLAAGKNSHLAMDYFVNKFSAKNKQVIELLIYTIVITFLTVIMVVNFQLAWAGRFAVSARLDISTFWFQISFSVGALIMLGYYIYHLSVVIRDLKNKSLPGVSGEERGDS
jgi:TRAP-type transport system small permease protein